MKKKNTTKGPRCPCCGAEAVQVRRGTLWVLTSRRLAGETYLLEDWVASGTGSETTILFRLKRDTDGATFEVTGKELFNNYEAAPAGIVTQREVQP